MVRVIRSAALLPWSPRQGNLTPTNVAVFSVISRAWRADHGSLMLLALLSVKRQGPRPCPHGRCWWSRCFSPLCPKVPETTWCKRLQRNTMKRLDVIKVINSGLVRYWRTYLITTNYKQIRVIWVEDTRMKLVPAAIQLMYAFNVIPRLK